MLKEELVFEINPTFAYKRRLFEKSLWTFHSSHFSLFPKVFFVNPVDSKSAELLKVANELLHNSFPVR